MALVSPVLSSSLMQILGNPSDSAPLKAQQIALAYNTYALPAMAATLVPVFIGVEQSAFMAKLLPVFNNPNSTGVQFANAVASAVETFWLFPPVLFSVGPLAGAVTAFTGKGVLVSTLVSIMSNTYEMHEAVAHDIADALDVATKTVTVTYAPPPGSTATLV